MAKKKSRRKERQEKTKYTVQVVGHRRNILAASIGNHLELLRLNQ